MSRLAPPLVALLGFLLLGSPVDAQLSQPGASAGWAPIQVGVRGGYDYNSTGYLLGAQLHIPLLPTGIVEIMPNADVTFLKGLKEYQYGVEAVFVTGGRRGGLYAGGGIGWRNSIYEQAPKRETKTTPTVVVGLRANEIPSIHLVPQVEVRWIFLPDVKVDPRVLSFGVNLPLWGWTH